MSSELYGRITRGQDNLIAHLGDIQRSIHIRGGSFEGSRRLVGDSGELAGYFDSWLGADVRENGGRTWRGLIYEMSYRQGPTILLKSMNRMANDIRVTATANNQQTASITDADSIAEYGRIKQYLEFNGGIVAANNFGRTELERRAWPEARPAAISLGAKGDELEIRMAGYSYTLRWDYPPLDLAIQGSASASYLVRVIASTSQFITPGEIETNNLPLYRAPQGNGLQCLNAICDMGDADNNPWTFTIDQDLRLHYHPVSREPKFVILNNYISRNEGGSMAGAERSLTPGVWRSGTLPERPVKGWLGASNLMLVEEVSVNERGEPRFGVEGYDEYQLYQARQRYAQRAGSTENVEIALFGEKTRPITYVG